MVVANLLDQSLGVQATVGVVAVAGHNWSPYLRFTGGRGLATGFGVLLGLFVVGLFMWKEMLTLAFIFGVIGLLIARDTAFWAFVCILLLPVLAYVYGEPTQLIYMSFAAALLLMLKRLTANWETPPAGHNLSRVLMFRLLWTGMSRAGKIGPPGNRPQRREGNLQMPETAYCPNHPGHTNQSQV